jgi:hypothetical protein
MNNEINIRDYRIDLENYPFFNNKASGIALLDLLTSFIAAYILQDYLAIYFRNKYVYYLSVIPLGILVHFLIGTKTFLNTRLMDSSFNIYKILIILNIYLLFVY